MLPYPTKLYIREGSKPDQLGVLAQRPADQPKIPQRSCCFHNWLSVILYGCRNLSSRGPVCVCVCCLSDLFVVAVVCQSVRESSRMRHCVTKLHIQSGG